MAFYRKFIMGDNFFTAWGLPVAESTGVLFSETNWDDIPEVSYNSEIPSFDDGVYISDAVQVGPRTVTVKFVAQFPEGNSVRGVRSVLRAALQARRPGSITMVTMTTNDLGVYVETYREVLENTLFVGFTDWVAKEDLEASGTITFLCPKPWKKAYVNKSTTSEWVL